MTRLQKYQILNDETQMCRAVQLEKDMQEIKMLYSCTQDNNLMLLFKKTKRQYDAITKQIEKNMQKMKRYDWR